MNMEQQVHRALERAVENHEISGGSVLVRVKGCETLYTAAGYADIEAGTPIRRDSIFRLYSQSKPITAAAVMLLVQRGEIDLTDGVDKYLPGFRNPRMYTPAGDVVSAPRAPWLSELMCMTAGLSYPAEDAPGQYAAKVFMDAQEQIAAGGGIGTVAFCSRLGEGPLAFAPGSFFRYSTCADVLGAVVEVASGRPFGQFLREELFEPLGMKDTAFWVPEEKRSRFVTCYRRVPGGMEPWTQQHLAVGNYTRSPAFESGGAGLVSTLDDYAAFGQMLLNGGVYNGRRIMSENAVRYMTSAQIGPDFPGFWEHLAGHGYGKLMRVCVQPGAATGLTCLGEYGWDGWLGTYFANLPNEQTTILFMTNATNTGTSAITRKIRNLVLGCVED